MLKVVGVRFKQVNKIHYFDPQDFKIKRNDFVIAESLRGIEYGQVVSGIIYHKEDELLLPLKPLIRIATEEDYVVLEENKKIAKSALDTCQKRAAEHIPNMKVVDAEYTFDRGKVTFYFTADGRVDFRQLVRDLASIFRTRIELRQIGVRDEAKMLGGIGPCGRVLCCSSFLGDFAPVSIKMAKDQGLSLNPAKISGLCGRLMCCLKYENDSYERVKRSVPDIGKYVKTPGGTGRVVMLDLLGQRLKVEILNTGNVVEYGLEDVLSETTTVQA